MGKIFQNINFLFLVLFALLFFSISSCEQHLKSEDGTSKGDVNSLTIIIPDHLWNGEVGDSLRKKFANSVDGLLQEEPMFTIHQFNNKFLDNQTAFNRNIIIIKKDDKAVFKFEKNKFAHPQNVVHFTGNDVNDIIGFVDKYGDSLVTVFKQTEISKQQEINRSQLLEDFLIQEKFNVKLEIPNSYQLVLEKKSFLWYKKDVLGGNASLLIYRVPFRALLKDDNLVGNIINVRDIVGAKYIKGKLPNTRMITEESYAPYFQSILLDGRRAYETKGTWELKGDFMSGSFINYAIMDRDKKEFLIVEGFCYAPSIPKRDLMFELQAIIKSVQFLSTKK